MRRRAFVLLLGPGLLAGCTTGIGGGYYAPTGTSGVPIGLGQPMPPNETASGGPVAILLPLTGSLSNVGQPMLKAAQLALSEPGSPPLLARDTGGNPQGAAAAAQSAIAAGARLILGPLTAAETAAVAPVARGADVLVLAFTNDPTQAQPGVWTLGITPGQQVRRLVEANQAEGRTQTAALLPDSAFGHAMGQALQETATSLSLPPPNVYFHEPGMASVQATARLLADYANRRGPIEAKIRQDQDIGTPVALKDARELARQPIPPPSFNVLLLADSGEALGEVASMLAYYDVDRSQVQFIGPAGWATPTSGSLQVPGAWYAAPDPAARSAFEQAYSARYGASPPIIADLAFDAAAIARVLSGAGGYSVEALTQSPGFVGSDGWLALLPDGQVRRGLAVFKVRRGGPEMIEPAPQSAAGSGA